MHSKTSFIAIGLTLLVVYMVGSGIWVSANDAWYRSLNAPSFQPPDWVFGTIWPYNFLIIAISIFTIAKASPTSRMVYLVAFGLSVAAALTWANQFYIAHNLYFAAFALMCVPILTFLVTILIFRSSILVGSLFLPYQIWVSIATLLSFSYAAKN